MQLVIGGAYQGKKEYVKRSYQIEESQIWQGGYPVAEGKWRCICGLHKIVRGMLDTYQSDHISEKSEKDIKQYDHKSNDVNTDRYGDHSSTQIIDRHSQKRNDYFGESKNDEYGELCSDQSVGTGGTQQMENYVNRITNYFHSLIKNNPDIIFICDEVGNGIVPIEKSERDYRECVGRVLCVLAKEADRVERVHCGIGQVIKNKVYISFIRHGSTEGNLKKQYIGVTDEPLCSAGIETLQARCKEGIYPQTTRVIASPMKRCLETAEILYPDVTPEVYPEFRETNFGLLEGKSYEELLQDDSLRPSYQEWIDSNGTLPFPEGESMEQMKRRCAQGFEKLLGTLTSDAVIVAHGGTIMSILHLYATPQKGYYDYQCGNGAGYLCRVELTGDKRLYQMKVVGKIE